MTSVSDFISFHSNDTTMFEVLTMGFSFSASLLFDVHVCPTNYFDILRAIVLVLN